MAHSGQRLRHNRMARKLSVAVMYIRNFGNYLCDRTGNPGRCQNMEALATHALELLGETIPSVLTRVARSRLKPGHEWSQN